MIPALRQWQETKLVCAQLDGYRGWEPGFMPQSENDWQLVASWIERSDFCLVLSNAGFRALPTEDGRFIAYMEDTETLRNLKYAQGNLAIADKVFVVPDLMRVLPDATPLLQPTEIRPYRPRRERVVICHSPGSQNKYAQKRSRLIQDTITRLAGKFDFEYRVLMGLPHAECLDIKADADIFIDTLATDSYIRGVAKSGLEAMAAGAVVVTAMDDYWGPHIPARDAQNADELEAVLRELLTQPREALVEQGQASRDWAKRHVAPEAWLTYFRAHLPEDLRRTTRILSSRTGRATGFAPAWRAT